MVQMPHTGVISSFAKLDLKPSHQMVLPVMCVTYMQFSSPGILSVLTYVMTKRVYSTGSFSISIVPQTIIQLQFVNINEVITIYAHSKVYDPRD